DLLDVDVDFARSLLLNLGLELLDLRALAADDDARARGVDDDADLVAGAGDLERADAGGAETALEGVAQLDVLEQQLGVALGCEPLGFPRLDEAEAEAVGMDFLTHALLFLFLGSGRLLLGRRLLRGGLLRRRRLGGGLLRRQFPGWRAFLRCGRGG